MKKQPENKPLIEEPPSWHCRVGTTEGFEDKKGRIHRTVKAELVFGRDVNTDPIRLPVIKGKVCHRLTGSTAESAIRDIAKTLNLRKATPNDTLDECFADQGAWERLSGADPDIPMLPQEQDALI